MLALIVGAGQADEASESRQLAELHELRDAEQVCPHAVLCQAARVHSEVRRLISLSGWDRCHSLILSLCVLRLRGCDHYLVLAAESGFTCMITSACSFMSRAHVQKVELCKQPQGVHL